MQHLWVKLLHSELLNRVCKHLNLSMPKQEHIQAKVKGLFKVLYIDLQCVAWTQSPYSTDMATVGRDSILLIIHSSHQGRLCSQALSAEGRLVKGCSLTVEHWKTARTWSTTKRLKYLNVLKHSSFLIHWALHSSEVQMILWTISHNLDLLVLNQYPHY